MIRVEKPSKIINRELRKRDVTTLSTADTTRIRKNIHLGVGRVMTRIKLLENLKELHLTLDNLGETKTNKEKYCS